MRRAMFEAEVGDDVLGDDPTVIRLQEKVAALLGKEAALFVPSGTMANQVAVRTHTEAGDEIIAEAESHVFLYETGGLAALSGVQVHLVQGSRGLLTTSQIEGAIRPRDHHFPPTKLVVLENTHNHGGGTIYPLETVRDVRALCDKHGLRLHMDGARLWNACVRTGVAPKDYARLCDSVSVCLSKGLGAPVGSLITGSTAFIDRARRFRKMFGGAMRQSGILAAAGIYALDHQYDRLQEDHENARWFADRLAEIPGVEIRPDEVETNLVFFGVRNRSPQWLEAELRKRHVWVFAERPTEVRAVAHLDVSRSQFEEAVRIVADIARS